MSHKTDDPLDAILDRVDKHILQTPKPSGKKRKKVLVSYSAYDYVDEEHDIAVDNLDEVPIPGKIVIREKADRFWGGDKARDFESPVLDSPTWLDLCVQADNMIRKTRDTHHVFLELIQVVKEETINGETVKICEFSMGS